MLPKPTHLDLEKERGLTVTWADGTVSFYPIAYLRKRSPSADQRALDEQIQHNPLTVLPASSASPQTLTAVDAELVGRYAIRIRFSDGHDTGIFSWSYLRDIDPGPETASASTTGEAGDARTRAAARDERRDDAAASGQDKERSDGSAR